MGHQFRKHYTREEARALIPQLRQWLESLVHWRDELRKLDQRLCQLLSTGADVGGNTANDWVRAFCATRRVLLEFSQREIQLKDIDRGIVDFPAVIGGREVFLCWERDEDDIEFWHDLNAGYAGRERL